MLPEEYMAKFDEMLGFRNYKPSTRANYRTYVKVFVSYVITDLHTTPEEVSWDDVRTFINKIQAERNLCDQTVNYLIAHLMFFYEFVLHRPWDKYQIPTRKVDHPLQYILTRADAEQFIRTIQDKQIKMIVILMYSAGLRISEACALRYENVSRAKMQIFIPLSKNRSGHTALLSREALNCLTQYWRLYGRPTGYLFPNPKNPDKHIDPRKVGKAITKHEAELGWPHRITCHTFRRTFASLFIEDGGSITVLKDLLGHKSIVSTARYVQTTANSMARAVSPFDINSDGKPSRWGL